MKEITYEEMKALREDSFQLIDIRDEGTVAYGMIPGALNFTKEELEENSDEVRKKLAGIPKDKKLIFYCEIGRSSLEIDDTMECLSGWDVLR